MESAIRKRVQPSDLSVSSKFSLKDASQDVKKLAEILMNREDRLAKVSEVLSAPYRGKRNRIIDNTVIDGTLIDLWKYGNNRESKSGSRKD